MTDNEFHSRLDAVAKKRVTAETLAEFVLLLKQGYVENLQLIIAAVDDKKQENCAKQAYVGDFNERLMLCYTSFEHGRADLERRFLPMSDFRKLSICTAKRRDIVDNMLNKPQIAALAFNGDTKEPYILPKQYIHEVFTHYDELRPYRI